MTCLYHYTNQFWYFLGYLPWQNANKMHLLHKYVKHVSGIQLQCLRFLATKYEQFLLAKTTSSPLLQFFYSYLITFCFSDGIFISYRSSQSQAKENSRKPDLRQGPTVQYHELPIMFVNANYNNTMFTITDHKGITPLDFLCAIGISALHRM